MSPNTTSHKLLPIFTSYFWPAALSLFMAVFLSQWAVAHPPAETDPPAAATSEEALPALAQEPMELSIENESADDSEGTPDAVQPQTTPAANIKSSEKCYEQTDGSFECVCEGQEQCKALETADYCMAGTHWGKDGYGGCTKIADK